MTQAMMMKKNSYNDRHDFRFKLDRLKDSVDPRYLLENLGFNIVRDSAKELRGPCKIHGGDGKGAFRFNKDTRTWVCFSHHCEYEHGNDIIGIVKGALNVDFVGAKKYLENLVGDIDASNYVEYKRKKTREKFIKLMRDEKPKSPIGEEALKKHKPFRSKYFIDQGYTKETLDFFEIAGGYTDANGLIRDIIPIRDANGLLVGCSMRDIRDFTDYDNKYIHTIGFNKNDVLYNLHNAKKYINEKPLIIVEGFKSVWRFHQHGISNTVAVMGSNITLGQIGLLCEYALNGVVIMFDNDVAGYSGCVSACNNLKNRVDAVPIFITEVDEEGKGLDPSDLSKKVIYDYLKGYF